VSYKAVRCRMTVSKACSSVRLDVRLSAFRSEPLVGFLSWFGSGINGFTSSLFCTKKDKRNLVKNMIIERPPAHIFKGLVHPKCYLPLCSTEERNSYRFGTTWGWVNDDRIFIFGWTIPLRRQHWPKTVNKYLFVYSLLLLTNVRVKKWSIPRAPRAKPKIYSTFNAL